VFASSAAAMSRSLLVLALLGGACLPAGSRQAPEPPAPPSQLAREALDALPRVGDQHNGSGCRLIGGALVCVIVDREPAVLPVTLADREERILDFVLED
jgi:hypothetical protein